MEGWRGSGRPRQQAVQPCGWTCDAHMEPCMAQPHRAARVTHHGCRGARQACEVQCSMQRCVQANGRGSLPWKQTTSAIASVDCSSVLGIREMIISSIRLQWPPSHSVVVSGPLHPVHRMFACCVPPMCHGLLRREQGQHGAHRMCASMPRHQPACRTVSML